MVAIKIIIINLNKFHLGTIYLWSNLERAMADQGASGNEVILFKTSTNTENIEALNARARKSQELF